MGYRQSVWILVLFFSAIVSGCGGGGGSMSGGTNPPPKPTYSVSVTVSGLAGNLYLQNNGADLTVLSTNGRFSFRTPVDSGKTYEVTIWHQPLNATQFCVVVNGKGTALANVTDVQVTCTTPSGQVLYNFGVGDDAYPNGTLVFDNAGNIYGTTSGGDFDNGSVFMLTPGNGQWTETVLHRFCQLINCPDGRQPSTGVVFDSAGNLYGTTSSGGAFGGGVVFKLSPNGTGTWTETVLHSFGSGSDGAGLIISGLVFDQHGNLYGTTSGGGTGQGCNGGCGTVFKLSPNLNGTWTESVIYNFCPAGTQCSDGAGPVGGVVLDAAGNLYGTTYSGGGDAFGWGTVFQLTPTSGGTWVEKVIYAFNRGMNGAPLALDGTNPRAGVILDAAGNLYGTTWFGYCTPSGSACNNGSVYEVVRGTGGQWQEKLLYGFHLGTDGINPTGSLIMDKAGNIYGTAGFGGLVDCNCGVVFALTPGPADAMWAEVPLYTFQYTEGAGPNSGLVMDAEGALYGVAGWGGANGTGVVFKIVP